MFLECYNSSLYGLLIIPLKVFAKHDANAVAVQKKN